jgi:BolA protein
VQDWNSFFKFNNWKVILNRKLKIEKIIVNYFKPYFLSVLDVSEQHRGHQNFKEDVESHFEIIIVSEKFHNKNKIDRHRMVNECLKEEFLLDLHSVVIKTYTIDEHKYI